jgi:NADPH:quinone reductase-like Zn-dependent oxidoreductase
MRALRLHQEAGPEGLAYEEAPAPEPGMGEVLVAVHAASFTPTELQWPSTWVDRLGHDRRPIIPGHEVSGTVQALGYGTTGFAVGDQVYGLTDWYRDGALADQVAVEARNLAVKPASLDHPEAAALSLAGLTAWQALVVHGRLAPGQRVLISGAGGGVGSLAIQLARAADAHVVAGGRGWARELAVELGADRFVDLDRERVEAVAGEVDLVVDLVGGEVLERSWMALAEGGRLVSTVADPQAMPGRARGGAGSVFFVVEAVRSQLEELARRVDATRLRPLIGEVFALANGREAFQAKQRGGVRGKVVLRIPE